MLRIAICDDDYEILDEMASFIYEYGRENDVNFEIYKFSDGSELLASKLKYDLIFLDIEMRHLNGLDAAKYIREKDMNVPIVYITSHRGYFDRAFKVHAFDYVTKPLQKERLTELMNDYFASLHDASEAAMQVLTGDGFVSYRINEIYFFIAEEKKNIYLHTETERILIRENLQDIYNKLDKTQFYMARRDCIINLRYVRALKNNFVIVMKNDFCLPLAQKKTDEFAQKLSSVFADKLKGQKL